MQQSVHMRKLEPVATRRQHGFTLIELIVATVIMLILVGAAVPIAKNAVARDRERELRQDLWMIRDAIDRYKDAADRGGFQTKVGSDNYPPDLDTLVRRGCVWKETEVSAPHPVGSHHQTGLGNAFHAGRQGFEFLGWPERF